MQEALFFSKTDLLLQISSMSTRYVEDKTGNGGLHWDLFVNYDSLNNLL